jgi:phytoene synthase
MDQIVQQSRETMAQGSASFRAATRLFDRPLREDVWALYAWCRYCDDEIDGQELGHGFQPMTRDERLARLQPTAEPPFQALERVASHHALDDQWPQELLDGFAMDVEERRYRTTDELLEYCWGVAGVVGVMMAAIMGATTTPVLRRAQDLGLAFQLTNIVRDIMEDAEAGRLYVPEQTLARAGAPANPAALTQARREAVFQAALELLDLAEAYYASSRAGLRALPFRAALATAAARGVYREIGRRIRRAGPHALDARMTVPRRIKLFLVLRGTLVALWSRMEKLTPLPPRQPLWSRI